MYIIHHSRDLDGWGSGAVCKRKYPYATLIGYDYGQSLEEIDTIPDGSEIIMVDVSLSMDEMFKLAKRCKLTWIDHHKSAIEDYDNSLDGEHPPFYKTVLVIGKAAIELTWETLYPDSEMPIGIKMLGDYDVWRNQDQFIWNSVTLPFQMGMRLVCNSAETFPIVIFGKTPDDKPSSNQLEFVDDIMAKGALILQYQKMQNEAACKNAFEAEIEGYKAICLNGGGFNSQVFDSIWDPNKYDVMIPFVWTGKFWKLSFYTTKDEVDCSVLAKKLGGGGHQKAAGTQVQDVFSVLHIVQHEHTSE